jgi:hypothetical protein
MMGLGTTNGQTPCGAQRAPEGPSRSQGDRIWGADFRAPTEFVDSVGNSVERGLSPESIIVSGAGPLRCRLGERHPERRLSFAWCSLTSRPCVTSPGRSCVTTIAVPSRPWVLAGRRE